MEKNFKTTDNTKNETKGKPALRKLKDFYRKYKEGLLYLLFGGQTFFLAIITYSVFIYLFSVHELVANAISWVAGVTFSFFTTRKWVFRQKPNGAVNLAVQMASFFIARLATLLLQEIFLCIFVTLLSYGSVYVKVCTEFLNIVLNYLVSKFIIFRK